MAGGGGGGCLAGASGGEDTAGAVDARDAVFPIAAAGSGADVAGLMALISSVPLRLPNTA